MLAQFHAPKHAQNQHLQAFYGLTSKTFEVNKMQTSDYSPEHYPTQSRSGLFLVALLSLGAFLFYAVQSHLITDGFVTLMSLFFENFSIKTVSSIADIAILIFFLLALLGRVVLVRSFFPIFIFIVVLAVLAAVFMPNSANHLHEVKVKSNDKHEQINKAAQEWWN
jgi:predicted membrane protein